MQSKFVELRTYGLSNLGLRDASASKKNQHPGRCHTMLSTKWVHHTKCRFDGYTTQCQDEVRILSGRTQKLKVAKPCWKQLNEHNLMYIYHKQCENMQKIQ